MDTQRVKQGQLSLESIVNKIGAYLVLALQFHAFFLFLLQIWGWIYSAKWVPISLMGLFTEIHNSNVTFTKGFDIDLNKVIPTFSGDFSIWLERPETFLGVHQVVDYIVRAVPLTIFEIALAFLLVGILRSFIWPSD